MVDCLAGRPANIHAEIEAASAALGSQPLADRNRKRPHVALLSGAEAQKVGLMPPRHDESVAGADRIGVRDRSRCAKHHDGSVSSEALAERAGALGDGLIGQFSPQGTAGSRYKGAPETRNVESIIAAGGLSQRPLSSRVSAFWNTGGAPTRTTDHPNLCGAKRCRTGRSCRHAADTAGTPGG